MPITYLPSARTARTGGSVTCLPPRTTVMRSGSPFDWTIVRAMSSGPTGRRLIATISSPG
jgi:hypothetical protein